MMTLYKSSAVAVATCLLLASPASTLSLNGWLTEYQTTIGNFTPGSSNEISVQYEIGKSPSIVDFTVMTQDCVAELDDDTSPIIDITGITTPFNSSETDIFTAAIDLDMTLLADSQIWDWDDGISMCAKIDLKTTDNTTIKTDKTNINIELVTRTNFTVDNVTLAKKELYEGYFVGTIRIVASFDMQLPGFDPSVYDHIPLQIMLQAFATVLTASFPHDGSCCNGTGYFPDAANDIVFYSADLNRRSLRSLEDVFQFSVTVTYEIFCDGTDPNCGKDLFDIATSRYDTLLARIDDGSFLEALLALLWLLLTDKGLPGDLFGNDFIVGKPSEIEFDVSIIGFSETTASVQNYVKACTCDDKVNFQCNSNTLGKDDLVNICIEPNSDDVEVDYVDSLFMQQGNVRFDVVENGGLEDDQMSSMEDVDDHYGVHVASVIPSIFFNYESTSTLTISGTVFMKLAGSSRRLGVILDPEDEAPTATGSRALAAPEKSGFNIAVKLELEQDKFGAEIDGPDTDTNVATKASSNIMSTGVIVAIAASATVVVAIMAAFLVKRSRDRDIKNVSVAKPASF